MTKDDLKRILEKNPSLDYENPNLRSLLASVTKRRTSDALEKVAEGETKSHGRPIISFTFCRTRLLDADGYRGGEKDLLDGLKKAGLIFDDKATDIDLKPAQQKKVSKKLEEGTIIEIEI